MTNQQRADALLAHYQSHRSKFMPLPEDEDDRVDACEKQVIRLMHLVQAIGRFDAYEIRAHSHALEIVRDRMSQILDRAEGK